jgi:hypothetical protein
MLSRIVGFNALIFLRLTIAILVADVSQVVQIQIGEKVVNGALLLNLVYLFFEYER